MEYRDAFFISELPYRKKLYTWGRWLQSGGPDSDHWSYFLRNHFTGMEVDRAMERSREILKESSKHPPLRFVSIWDESYPENLKHIFDPPPVVFYSGRPFFDGSHKREAFAIVGTRKPATIALVAVDRLLQSMSGQEQPVTIVSGFARGIDRRAHLASLRYEMPTIAVLGAGLWRPGPVSNLDLLKRGDGNLFSFLSEFPPDRSGIPYHFPRRNRIIAGLVNRVYLMQAPKKSGGLITAQFALDEGRDVIVFDHDLLKGEGFNEGGRNLLEQGAIPLNLNELDKNVFRMNGPARGFEYHEKLRSGDLFYLGGDFYYRKEDKAE